ncbi:MAG: type I-E CRISPR-associated protein Cas6/Cse3/CasE [Bacteroidota bacterium]
MPYDLHRTLSKYVFPGPRATDQPEGEGDYDLRHGMLFRIESATRTGVPVLVQSSILPDWERLPAGYSLLIDGPKSFQPRFAEGQQLRFRVVANPVRRVRVEGKKNPRRMPLVHPHAKEGIESGYFDWLERQAKRHGFALVRDTVVDAPFRIGRKRRLKPIDGTSGKAVESTEKARLGLFGVRFDGVLRVNDPEKVLGAIRTGIGPAKAFGFGLLSLAPVRR